MAELARQIQRRFGLAVNEKTLYRLSGSQPIQHTDLAIAGAAAKILDVRLDDLFEVQVPIPDRLREDPLTPAESRRMSDLFDKASNLALSESERDDPNQLVEEYSRRVSEKPIHEIARQRGITLKTAREQVEADYRRLTERTLRPRE